jgi:hypothetical protein
MPYLLVFSGMAIAACYAICEGIWILRNGSRFTNDVREEYRRNDSFLNRKLGFTPDSGAPEEVTRWLGPGYVVVGCIFLAVTVFCIITRLRHG